MRILVTGAAGFIGKWTATELARAGDDVIGIDRVATPNGVLIDITKLDEVVGVFENVKPEAVIHLAAISGSTGKNEIEQSIRQCHLNFKVNAFGTANICEAARLTGVSKMVYMSSFSVYGRTGPERLPIDPQTPVDLEHAYATSKFMGELTVRTYCQDFGLRAAIFRTPFIVGEYQNEKNVLIEFVEAALEGRDLLVFGKGTHKREFVHPLDLVKAYREALGHVDSFERNCELFVLGNTPISIADLANLVTKITGRGSVKYIPGSTERAFDQCSNYGKATSKLGWTPVVSTESIVRRLVEMKSKDEG